MVSYSLGDAIDWKRTPFQFLVEAIVSNLLLARGRDRLETAVFPVIGVCDFLLLLARGRDRLETCHLCLRGDNR